MVSEEGPPHARHYVVEVLVGGDTLGRGEGRNRRDAETEAAREALGQLVRPTTRGRRGPGEPSEPMTGEPTSGSGRSRLRREHGQRPLPPCASSASSRSPSARRSSSDPGISAIVGPNGSGKSNLADALRWTLGEQGRTLRTRRAEDVIFAGSSTRQAIGMADVTLVIDNADRLLPVDYGGGRDRPAALPLGRERVPAQPPAHPAARPGRAARRRQPRRQRLPVHRPGHGRPGPGAAARGASAAVRGGGRRAPARTPTPPGRGTSWPRPSRTSSGCATSWPSCGRRQSAWPRRPSSCRRDGPPGSSWPKRCCSSARARWIGSATTERLEAKMLKDAHDARGCRAGRARTPPRTRATSTSEQMASHAEQERRARARRWTATARRDRRAARDAGTDRIGARGAGAGDAARLSGEREVLDARLRESTLRHEHAGAAAGSCPRRRRSRSAERGLAEAVAACSAPMATPRPRAALTRELDARRS